MKQHKMIGSERIDTFVISSDSVGKPSQTDIAPQAILLSRLATLANAYQKYRFTKLKFRLAPGIATSVSGTYTAGFSNEVDWAPKSANDIFVTQGAKTCTLWESTDIMGDVSNRRQNWFMTDLDSEERNDTIQGVFAFILESVSNLSGEVKVPLVMDYEIEFYGARFPSERKGAVKMTDKMTMAWRDQTGQWNVQTGAPEWVPEKPQYNYPYYFEPSANVPSLVGGQATSIISNHFRFFNSGGTTWVMAFYASRQDAIDDVRITWANATNPPSNWNTDPLTAYPL
jgi:hypothetical protein